ncbi:MAG: N(4)-(beta-N-acetylglucosaminyl)-L-asparaginase [Cyclobacteriaceae bacterium]
MANRRDFLKGSLVLAGTTVMEPYSILGNEVGERSNDRAIVISTWNHGMAANAAAWKILRAGGRAIDAVETGVAVTESDLTNRSVGLGGNPDREGKVTLDACLMDEESRCGAVAFLQHIDHPIKVARKIMEETPHVMLVGQGAYEFAIANGFKRSKQEIPHPEAMKNYKEWLKSSQYQPVINIENHDTIGMVAMDKNGNLSGACTTSGMAYKMHGRVGDSPIIGAGLFVDNEVGAATATGMGEAIIRIAGSHTVVELMRHGASPQEACEEAVARIIRKHKNIEGLQAGFIAIDKAGNHGGYSVYNGFNYALRTATVDELTNVKSKYKY